MKMMSYMKDEDKGGFRGLENILDSYQQATLLKTQRQAESTNTTLINPWQLN